MRSRPITTGHGEESCERFKVALPRREFHMLVAYRRGRKHKGKKYDERYFSRGGTRRALPTF